MSIFRPGRALPLMLAVLAALAGCGGDGPDTESQISQVLRGGFTSSDPAVLCERTLSPGLAGRIYGNVEACLAAERAAAGARVPASSVGVSQIVVTGDRGNAVVTLTGGDQAGTRGPVSLVRRDGRWRLEAFSTEFLRSGLKSGLVGNSGVPAPLAECLRGRLDGLDDAVVRRLAFGTMSARPEAVQEMQALVRECVEGTEVPGDTA